MSDPTREALKAAAPPGAWPIDEATRRRPGFEGPEAGAREVRMADGRAWWLPRVRIGLSLRPRADGAGLCLYPGPADATIAPLYDRALRASEPLQVILALMELVRALLLANYELDDDEAARLLTWVPQDPASDAIMAGWRRHVFPLAAEDEAARSPDEPAEDDDGSGRPKAFAAG